MHPDHMKLLKKAQALNQAKDLEGAVEAYAAFLARDPKHPWVWADYAAQLVQLGRADEALAACHTALELDSQCLSARNNLGCILMWRDQLDESEQQFRTVLTADRKRLDVRLNLAECLLKKKDLSGAQKILDEAGPRALIDPTHARLNVRHAKQWADLGMALLGARSLEGAEEAFNRALQIDPTNFIAKANLGSIQMAQDDLDEAEACFRKLIPEYPARVDVRLLLITCLGRKGELDACDQEIAEVLRLAPDSFEAHQSIMGFYFSHGRWALCRTELERFRAIDSLATGELNPRIEWEQSLQDLLFGDMPKGWDRNEARLRYQSEFRIDRTFVQPSWDGGKFHGKTLLLWMEQGMGDGLMMLRYLPLVKSLGGQVILEVHPPLRSLATTCKGVDLVIPFGLPLPHFDLQASQQSLPYLFQTDLSTIPAEIPYLSAPQGVAPAPELEACISQVTGCRRIGLVWAGNPAHPRDYERSIQPATLAPLAAIPGVTWFSLQLDPPTLPPLPNLISLGPWLKDFTDTAHALLRMDLLITVDTAVAHLAGALGIPTLLLISYQPDWRWLLDRDDSPWYPSLRLYRQPTYGDWDSVIKKLVLDLTPKA